MTIVPNFFFGRALHAGAQGRGEARAIALASQLAEAADDALPGLAIEHREASVIVSGRQLGARLLSDPVLRWLGALLR